MIKRIKRIFAPEGGGDGSDSHPHHHPLTEVNLLGEQPAGPGECAHCGIHVKDLVQISSTTLDYKNVYCYSCAKRAKTIIQDRVKQMRVEKEQAEVIGKVMEFVIWILDFGFLGFRM